MIKKSIKTIIKLATAIISVVVIVAVVFGMWVYSSPREISIFTRYLGRHLNMVMPSGLRVEVGGSLMQIDDKMRLSIEVTDFKIISKTKTELSTSGVALMIDPMAIFPQTPHKLLNITVSNPAIINNVLGDARSIGDKGSNIIERINNFLNHHSKTLMKFSFSINDIDLDFTKGDRVATLKMHQLVIKPNIVNHNMVFDLYGDLSIGKKNNILKARIDTSSGQHMVIDGTITKLSNFTLSEFGLTPAILEGADVEIDLDFKALLKSFRHIDYIEFNVSNYHGFLRANSFFRNDVRLNKLDVSGYCNHNCKHLFIEQFLIHAAELEVAGRLEVQPINNHDTLKLNLSVDSMPFPMLDYYWPHNMINRTREWIFTHIHDGDLAKIKANLVLDFDELLNKSMENSSVNIELDLLGSKLRYLEGVDELHDVDAHIKITNDAVIFDVHQAFINELAVEKAHGEILNITNADSKIKVEAWVMGDAGAMLDLSLQHSLRPIKAPYKVRGNAAANVMIGLPLRDEELRMQDIGITAEATVQDFVVEGVLGQHNLEGQNAYVKLFNHKIDVNTNAVLFGAPVEVKAHYELLGEKFSAILKGAFKWQDLRDRGLKIHDFINGEADINLKVQGLGNSMVHQIEADITRSVISYNEMNLFKPDKVMGLVSLRHRKADGKHVIDKYNVSIPSLKSVGSAIFDEDMSLLNAHSESTSWMRGAFSFDFKKESGVRRLSITGDSLDFKAINLKKQTHLTDLDISSQSIKPSQIINNSLLIEGDVSKVYLHNDVVLNMPLFKIQKVNDGLIHLSCSGHFDANDVVDINMNAPIINISTNNGGKLLKGLNISDKVRGGALIMSGELQDGRFQGKMTIDDYHMHKAPALAKLFSLISISSLEGLASLFDKGGIRFKKLDCPMNMYGGIISLDNCLASGPSLSMTASGYIDLNLQITEVHGTLAPENIISSTLRYVPILGNVLLSQKDQSLFGASYSIVGPIDDPKVSANPLSIFVPNRVKDAIVDSR